MMDVIAACNRYRREYDAYKSARREQDQGGSGKADQARDEKEGKHDSDIGRVETVR